MKMQYVPVCLCLLLISASGFFSGAAHAAPPESPGIFRRHSFDLTSTPVTANFKKFMRCNAGRLPFAACRADAAADGFLFTAETIESLRRYHIIMLPGGDYDFFSQLITVCEGERDESLDEFLQRYPVLGQEILASVEKNICQQDAINTELLYDKYMDAFISYEDLFQANEISYTRLPFTKNLSTVMIGDRPDKVSLLADTIDAVEEETPDNESKDYILMGHSYGGLNICDFLVELANAHVPGSPEERLFAHTAARAWPAEKKERIFKKIKGVALLNTFVQGDLAAEVNLYQLAKTQKLDSRDPVAHYIDYVLATGKTFDPETDNETRAYIFKQVLGSNRYRTQYYLKDKNTGQPQAETPITQAFDRIAREKAVISVGAWVPPVLPALLVEPNFIVHLSRKIWRQEGVLNDGMVNTLSVILPRAEVDFVLLPLLDHGALVLKPQVRGITVGHTYDQTPFIKTLLQRLVKKIADLPTGD